MPKLSIVLCLGLSGILSHFAYAQQSFTIAGDSITFNMIKIAGLGPHGHNGYGIAAIDRYPKEDTDGFPKIKNKPDNLTNITEYFFMLDSFQFYFQNYCTGIYSSDFFFKKAARQKWNLSDTVLLSRRPIKCAFSVLAGLNARNEPVYVIDANNNDDFGDDAIKPLFDYNNDQNMIVNSAVPVKINILSGNELKDEEILVFPSGKSNEGKIDLSFIFPEFWYSKFIYQGRPYIICADAYQFAPKVTVMPDRPNFWPVSAARMIGVNQYFPIGNSTFTLARYAGNGDKVTLVGKNVKGFSSFNAPVDTNTIADEGNKATGIYSNQYGFKAPVIKGYNVNKVVNDSSLISTADLKGKYIFIDFWSTFCGSCIAEFPYLRTAYLKYNRKQFEIIGVLEERNKDITAKLLNKDNVIWPTIKTNTKGTEIAGYDNINSFPTSYLIDPDGVIIAVNLRGNELLDKLKTLIR